MTGVAFVLAGLLTSMLFSLVVDVAQTLNVTSNGSVVLLKKSISVSPSPMSSSKQNGTMRPADEQLNKTALITTLTAAIIIILLFFGVPLGIFLLYKKRYSIGRSCCRVGSSESRRAVVMTEEPENSKSHTKHELPTGDSALRESNLPMSYPSSLLNSNLIQDTSAVFENQAMCDEQEDDLFHHPLPDHKISNASLTSSSSNYPQSDLSQPEPQSSQNELADSRPGNIQLTTFVRGQGKGAIGEVPTKRKKNKARKKSQSNDGPRTDSHTSGYCSNTSNDATGVSLPDTSSSTFLPDHMTPIHIKAEKSSKGVRYYDESNNLKLDIPRGAIPVGENFTIDFGVALFGPFQFPEGLRPVSPVFWVCVRDQRNFQFPKPVTVSIPHFLNLENDDEIQSLGLTFLKAEHNRNTKGLYEFKPTEGESVFEPCKQFGVLKTTHLCSLCIVCRDTPECLRMAHFCTTAVLPKCANSDGKKQTAYFFLTFYNLNTCLTKVAEVIENKHLDNYEKIQTPFRFKRLTNDPAVDIDVHQPTHGSIGVVGKIKVYRSEVDFFVRKRTSREDLQVAEHRDFYPPRFQIFLASSPKDPTLRGGRIKLKGARSNLQYDIYLDPPPSSTIPNDAYVPENYSLGIDDLQKVRSQLITVAVKWRYIGLQLGLKAHQLEGILYDNNNDFESCLNSMLKDWLRRAYDTTACGEPSWQKLSEAVSCRAGGNNPALARKILHLQTV